MNIPLVNRRRFLHGTMAFAGAGLLAGTARAIDIPDVEMAITRQAVPSHHIDDWGMPRTARQGLHIFRAIPKAPPPPGGYPVIYMLDGNAVFDLLTPEILASVPELMIVGVGYQGKKRFAVEARTLDYTPPLFGTTGPTPDPQRPQRLQGGAAEFFDRLTGPVREVCEKGIAIAPDNRSIWGHSLGGLFVLYALFKHPDSFARYIPVSPSLWWGGETYPALEAEAALRASTPADVLVMLGDMESRSGQPKLAAPRPAPATIDLIARLGKRKDLVVSQRILEGSQHGPALVRSIPFALNFAAAPARQG